VIGVFGLPTQAGRECHEGLIPPFFIVAQAQGMHCWKRCIDTRTCQPVLKFP
jgi:hypothetical protein